MYFPWEGWWEEEKGREGKGRRDKSRETGGDGERHVDRQSDRFVAI